MNMFYLIYCLNTDKLHYYYSNTDALIYPKTATFNLMPQKIPFN